MKKREVSLLLNFLLIVVEIIGFYIVINDMHRIGIEYYTEESNILALIVSIIYVIYEIKNIKIPKWLKSLKYISNVNLAITLLVVIFVLIPTSNFDVYGLLITKGMKYHHLFCPLISIISFIFFDNLGTYEKNDLLIGLSLTLVYAFIMIVANIVGTIVGPYSFLMVRNQTIVTSIIWLVLILGFSYSIALCLLKLHSKYNVRR